MTQTPYNHEHFRNLAATQTISDPATAACWALVVEGMKHDFLGGLNLGTVIEHLRQRWSYGLDELDFDWNRDAAETLTVTLLGESAVCSGRLLIAELERLGRRYRGEPEPDEAPEGLDAGTTAELGPLLAGLLAKLAEPVSAPDSAAQRQAAAARAQVSRLAHDLQSPDASVRGRAAVEVARLRGALTAVDQAAVARLAELERGGAVLAGLDFTALAETLNTLTDFLRGDVPPTSGLHFDTLVAALDRDLGTILGGVPAAAEAARDQRIRESARSAIAERLRKAGVARTGEKK